MNETIKRLVAAGYTPAQARTIAHSMITRKQSKEEKKNDGE